MSSRGSITHGVAKELAFIIKPIVGQSPHHLKNAQHFVQKIHTKRLEPGEIMTSFDVKALFTSVPGDPSIEIVQNKIGTGSYPTTKDQYVHPANSYPSWSSALKTHISSSKVSFMNRSMLLLWVPQLLLS